MQPTDIAATAPWITSPDWLANPDGPLPVLAARVHTSGSVQTARLEIAGVGVWYATLDGTPVGDPLEPGYTDWAIVTESVTIDLTGRLTPGQHIPTVELATGLYRSQLSEDRLTSLRGTSMQDAGGYNRVLVRSSAGRWASQPDW